MIEVDLREIGFWVVALRIYSCAVVGMFGLFLVLMYCMVVFSFVPPGDCL